MPGPFLSLALAFAVVRAYLALAVTSCSALVAPRWRKAQPYLGMCHTKPAEL